MRHYLCCAQSNEYFFFPNKNSVLDQQEKWEHFDCCWINARILNHRNKFAIPWIDKCTSNINLKSENWFNSPPFHRLYVWFVCLDRLRSLSCTDIITIRNGIIYILLTIMHLFHRPSISLHSVEMLISFVHVIVSQWKQIGYTMFASLQDIVSTAQHISRIQFEMVDVLCICVYVSLPMMVMYSHSIYNIG